MFKQDTNGDLYIQTVPLLMLQASENKVVTLNNGSYELDLSSLSVDSGENTVALTNKAFFKNDPSNKFELDNIEITDANKTVMLMFESTGIEETDSIIIHTVTKKGDETNSYYSSIEPISYQDGDDTKWTIWNYPSYNETLTETLVQEKTAIIFAADGSIKGVVTWTVTCVPGTN